MTLALSGPRYDLHAGGYAASISSVGASLRSLTLDGRDLVVPFEENEVRPAFRGATLAPWPNRVVDGRYAFGGRDYQLSLTEPARGHALHGLAAWLDFEAIEQADERVLLRAVIQPQAGYPFRIQVDADFALTSSGLRSTVIGRNLGPDAAPWGTGPHPYLVAGAGSVDDWTLTLPADRVLTVTDDRLIPIELAAVSDERGIFDFRLPRQIGDTFIDHAFTGLQRAEDGTASVVVTAPGGTGVTMTWGTECPWVQVHTADQPDPALSRRGLAVEPMTCPPDAFNSGTDLIVLAPGDAALAWWVIAGM
jgi:aldose 1-epimerase